MNPETVRKARLFLREARIAAEAAGGRINENSNILKRKKLRPPTVFKKSSYLYVAYSQDDLGNDIKNIDELDALQSSIKIINKATGNESPGFTKDQAYKIKCLIKNTGDLVVPSAKVELFVTKDFSINSLRDNRRIVDITYAVDKLKLVGIKDCWLNPNNSSEIEFEYTPDFNSRRSVAVIPDVLPGIRVPFEIPEYDRDALRRFLLNRSGKTLIVMRVFSFSPLDLPKETNSFRIYSDRHIGFKWL